MDEVKKDSKDVRFTIGIWGLGIFACVLLFVVLRPDDASRWPTATIRSRDFALGVKMDSPIASALMETPSVEGVMEHWGNFTARPHIAGSLENYHLALRTQKLMSESGFDTVLETHEVLLTYPISKSVSFQKPDGSGSVTLSLKEDGEDPLANPKCKAECDLEKPESDPTKECKGCIMTFHGLSPSGKLHAPVVYANYGKKEDFDKLKEKKIETKGRICLMRYGGVNRGVKVAGATTAGCVGALVYSDPADYGPTTSTGAPRGGKVWKDGPWLRDDGVQRGSLSPIWVYPGDLLTPGYPSLEQKVSESEAERKLKESVAIPSIPISARDARLIMREMKGKKVADVCGDDWVGNLGVEHYMLGDESLKLDFELKVEYKIRKIQNVVGTLRGWEEPEKVVVLGAHYDAWVMGAIDPGTAYVCQMETVKSFGSIIKKGWQPRRSIVIASWDAEEWGIYGSTEFSEFHRTGLLMGGIAYLNIDVTASYNSTDFATTGSPSLQRLFQDVTKGVSMPQVEYDPEKGASSIPETSQTVYEIWEQNMIAEQSAALERKAESPFTKDGNKTVPGVIPLGAGSDYAGFQHHLGVPSMDFRFEANGFRGNPQYHSVSDDLPWAKKYVALDQLVAISKVASLAAVRLADDQIIPLNYSDYTQRVSEWLVEYQTSTKDEPLPLTDAQLAPVFKALDRMSMAYKRLIDSVDPASPAGVRITNSALTGIERTFTSTPLKSRPWFRNIISAPASTAGYGSQLFPHIAEARESGSQEEVDFYVNVLKMSAIDGAVQMEDAWFMAHENWRQGLEA